MKRQDLLHQLKTQNFDILIVGGGATGAGAALDAATRGLKVALIEKDDFASGTSSRSTKLIHGGVRYLEQAVKKFDRGQFHLVKEALHERATLLKLAPHLSHPLPLVTPLYSYWEIPYYRMGLKIYDWLAGRRNLHPSRYLSAKKALESFPMLKAKGLRGGVLYYDGQFDDARMNVALALTAVNQGAVAANHVAVVGLLKQGGKLSGAKLRDTQSGDEFEVKTKLILNATGPFVDTIRLLDDPKAAPILRASSGIHIVLDKKFSPPATGLLIPKTEDGRVLFLLPWLGHTLVGTTDNPATIEANPKPSEADIDYILRHIEKYFDVPVHREDVLSAWSGLRPLVSNAGAANTAKLSRDHTIQVSASGLVTITGGKWTTYRRMAQDAVDEGIRVAKLQPKNASRTEHTPLYGALGYSPKLETQLMERYALAPDVARHLAKSYGGNAIRITDIIAQGYGARLSPRHPYLEAEVVYATTHELACSVLDVLARRMRLAFLDIDAARQALPRAVEIQGTLLGWDHERKQAETQKFLDSLADLPHLSPPSSQQRTA